MLPTHRHAADSERATGSRSAIVSTMRRMTRFLAIYHGAADELEKGELSEEQQSEFMNAWAAWAQTHQRFLVDQVPRST